MESLEERVAQMLVQSRKDGHKSQDFMSKALGVSKKTIQNWESAYACPTEVMTIRWFEALELNPVPYRLAVESPEYFTEVKSSMSDEAVDKALHEYMATLRPIDKRKLLFVIYGEHGSPFTDLIELMTAHFHTPDDNRLVIAQHIMTNYLLAKAKGTLVAMDNVKPNIDVLKRAILNKRNKLMGTND